MRMRLWLTSLWTTALLAIAPIAAWASEPVVGAGGKPGAAKSWTGDGTTLTFVLKDGFPAKSVADAIAKGVPGTTTKVDAGKVVVNGVEKAKLLTALEKVLVEPGADDVDATFATIQNTGGEEDGSGSSIRASKPTDMSSVMPKETPPLVGSVVKVQQGTFPMAVLTVKVLELPAGSAPATVKKGGTIMIVAKIPLAANGAIDPKDATATANAGSWYARPGDKIAMRIQGPAKDHKDTWLATTFERR
jgi:hypothetical protein